MESLVSSLSGAGGGIVSMALTYPLITIGTRLQTQTSKSSRRSYDGIVDAIRKIYSFQGLSGLYSGLGSALFGIAVTNGLYYYWYEFLKRMMERRQKSGRMSVVQGLAVGALAGAITVLITNPIWVVNTRLAAGRKSIDDQSPDSSPSVSANSSSRSLAASAGVNGSIATHQSIENLKQVGSLETLVGIVKDDGLASLWQGVWPALVLVANPSIQYMVFEQLKQRLQSLRGTKLTSLDHFLMGATSKLIATFLTYPYIVVKARMQLKQPAAKADTRQTENSYATTLASLNTILRNEGIGGLYKGLSSKLTQSVLTAAILFAAKDALEGAVRDMLLLLLSIRRFRTEKSK